MRALVVMILVLAFAGSGQERTSRTLPTPREHSSPQLDERSRAAADSVFAAVRVALNAASVRQLARSFAPIVQLSLGEAERGEFSTDQATQVVTRYLAGHLPSKCNFLTFDHSSPSPRASGTVTLANRGSEQTVRVYVALVWHEGRWLVSQFSLF